MWSNDIYLNKEFHPHYVIILQYSPIVWYTIIYNRRGRLYMLNVENHCKDIQSHIKKAKSNLSMFMYTPGGPMFILMTPFVYLHKNHFNKVE